MNIIPYILSLALQFLGIPYVAHTLDADQQERLVARQDAFDCTTYVETVTALTLCKEAHQEGDAAFRQQLQQLRYRNGEVSYLQRLHYFSAWIDENACKNRVEEIHQPAKVFRGRQVIQLHFMSRHASLYPQLKQHPAWVKGIQRMEQQYSGKTVAYIPKADLKQTDPLREVIHDGDILALVSNVNGLDVAHVGFAIWQKGELHLLHASSRHKKVVVEPQTLYEYMRQQPSQLGVRVIRIKSQL